MDPDEINLGTKFVPEEMWTAQMVGKHFIRHDQIVDIEYSVNPPETYVFEESDTY